MIYAPHSTQPYFKIVTNVTKWAYAQCRGTDFNEAVKLSRFNEFKLRAAAGIRVQEALQFFLSA